MLTLGYLDSLADRYAEALLCEVREFEIAGRFFPFNQRPSVMGVINLSPDSWYRESVCLDTSAALRRGRVLVEQRADIIDVGAESTLGHAAREEPDAQLEKLLPVIRELANGDVIVSSETYHLEVARQCLQAGARVLNLTGTTSTQSIYRLAVEHDAAVIICYVQGANVREVGDCSLDNDPIPLMHDYFAREVEKADQCGLDKIFLDAGLGFYYRNLQDSGLRVQRQLTTLLNAFRLRTIGFPVCNALPHAFEHFQEEVRSAEPFFAVMASLGKTDLFRSHEVPRVRAVLDSLQAF